MNVSTVLLVAIVGLVIAPLVIHIERSVNSALHPTCKILPRLHHLFLVLILCADAVPGVKLIVRGTVGKTG